MKTIKNYPQQPLVNPHPKGQAKALKLPIIKISFSLIPKAAP